jgi:hypothetical protein
MASKKTLKASGYRSGTHSGSVDLSLVAGVGASVGRG